MSVTKRIILGGSISLLLFGFLLLGYHFYSGWPGGMRPSYAAADYDPRLTREAATATPIIAALRRYHTEHSAFPAHAADFASYLSNSATPVKTDEILGWRYEPGEHGAGYVLSRKLGWDPSLQYRSDGAVGIWVFDPGDGSPEKTIILKP